VRAVDLRPTQSPQTSSPASGGFLLGCVLICGRPAKCKRFLKKLARSRMLPSVRPLMQRWCCGPVWEFADRNQIINACSRHDEYIWFFRPRLADCCAIPSFDRLHLRRPQARRAHALAATGAL
jgi:hypothetical protein